MICIYIGNYKVISHNQQKPGNRWLMGISLVLSSDLSITTFPGVRGMWKQAPLVPMAGVDLHKNLPMPFPMPTSFASKSMLCPWNAHENYLCGHESLWSQQDLLRIQKLLCPETLVGGLSDPQARDGRKSTRYWETKHGIFEFDMTLSTVINNVLIWLDLDRDNVR